MHYNIDVVKDPSLEKLAYLLAHNTSLDSVSYDIAIDDLVLRLIVYGTGVIGERHLSMVAFVRSIELDNDPTLFVEPLDKMLIQPCLDMVLQHLGFVRELFGINCWAELPHQTTAQLVETIKQMVSQTQRINKLKAFC